MGKTQGPSAILDESPHILNDTAVGVGTRNLVHRECSSGVSVEQSRARTGQAADRVTLVVCEQDPRKFQRRGGGKSSPVLQGQVATCIDHRRAGVGISRIKITPRAIDRQSARAS